MSRSLRPLRAFLIVSLAVLCLVGLAVATVQAGQPSAQLAPISAASLPSPLTINGSPLRVVLGADSSIQVYGWADGSADSGIWLWVNGEIYGPDFCFAGRVVTAMYTVRPWTQVSRTGPTGSGTAGDPWVVTTVLDAGTSGVRVTQRAR